MGNGHGNRSFVKGEEGSCSKIWSTTSDFNQTTATTTPYRGSTPVGELINALNHDVGHVHLYLEKRATADAVEMA